MKTRVVYWTNIPSPYMVDRFNAIARRGNLDFSVWFNERIEPDRSWDVDEAKFLFPYEYTGASSLQDLPGMIGRFQRAHPDVLVTLYGTPLFAAGVLSAKMLHQKVMIHVLKTFDTWVKRTWPKEASKRFLFPRVSGFHVSGEDAAAYVTSYGGRQDSIYAFPEPIDVGHYADQSRLTRDEKGAREALKLKGCVFLYVGRLWQGKGIDYMIEAYRRLRADGISASLLIVGDGVDEARYRAMVANVPDVVFSGFVQQSQLPSYYGLADVFVFPTLGDPYGHVVQEAMASSLPVISSANAGDIAGRVIEGRSGFIVPPADSDALYEKMRLLATDAELRQRMGAAGYEVIEPRTIDWWASKFEGMVEEMAAA